MPIIDKKITLGDLVQAVILTGGIVVGYANLRKDVDSARRDINGLQSGFAVMADTQNKMAANDRVLGVLLAERTGKPVSLQEIQKNQ